METQHNKDLPQLNKNESKSPATKNRSGNILGGFVIVIVGALLLAKQLGVLFPGWLFSFPMILVAIGLFVGARNNFRDYGWLIPVIIGVVLLADDFIYDIALWKLFWPVMIIVIGLVVIFKPRRKSEGTPWHQKRGDQSSEDYLDCVTIFGGVKKNIISKEFKGGEAVTIMGGIELNLMQADVTDKVELEMVQVFGGAKLIVPAHWRIKTDEMVSIFGGLTDKRMVSAAPSSEPEKVLILKGTCIFGGLDIHSY